jgi:hypothetical protein
MHLTKPLQTVTRITIITPSGSLAIQYLFIFRGNTVASKKPQCSQQYILYVLSEDSNTLIVISYVTKDLTLIQSAKENNSSKTPPQPQSESLTQRSQASLDSPGDNDGVMEDVEGKVWYKGAMLKCDGFYLLPNWEVCSVFGVRLIIFWNEARH